MKHENHKRLESVLFEYLIKTLSDSDSDSDSIQLIKKINSSQKIMD